MKPTDFKYGAIFLLLTGCVLSLSASVSFGNTAANDGEIVVALSAPISTIDSLTQQSSDTAAESLRPLIFNSLTRRGSDLSTEGDLAKEIVTSHDGRSISFILREGVRFHDGRELTSNDVRYSLETLFSTNGYKAFAFFETLRKKHPVQNLRLISEITVEGPLKITLHIARPDVKEQILSNLASIPIVPSGSIAPGQDLRVGTGPFRLISLDADKNEVRLEAHPDYFEGKPGISFLRFRTILEFESMYVAFQDGDIDLFRLESWVPQSQRKKFAELKNIKIRAFDGNNIQYLGLNVEAPLINDVRIRRAIALAIDREKIIAKGLGGNARPAYSVLPERSWAYSAGRKYEFDIETARKLVRSSKDRSRTIKFQVSSGNYQLDPSVIDSIRESLRAAGLNIEIEFLDPSILRLNLMRGNFQLSIGTWVGGNQDPLFLRDLFHSTKIPAEFISCCNRSRYRNALVDRFLDSATGKASGATAAGEYRQAWEIISQELPIIPLWYPADVIAFHRRVQIRSEPHGGFLFLKDVTLEN